jgi:hypothetical protein
MYIYNVTVNISEEARENWLAWMKDQHIPDVMKTGCFTGSQIMKLLFVEDEGHTYSIQYKFAQMTDIEKYQKEFAPALQAQHQAKFKNQYHAFRTLLEIIE